jgi:hypothetical protein
MAKEEVRSMSKTVLEITPRGLRREGAATYLGISPSKFDQGRKDGKIPAPRNFLGVALYCRFFAVTKRAILHGSQRYPSLDERYNLACPQSYR